MKKVIDLYKQAYKGLSRENWYLAFVMLINRSGTMVLPFMTIYCTQKLHFTIDQAGIVMAFFGIGSVAGAYTGGRLTDKLGFYNVQLAALFSGGILFTLLSFLESLIGLCIGVFILSLCNEAVRPANSAATAFYSAPENRTRSYSLNRLSVNLGWAVGGGLGGLLASINYKLLFWVDGLTNIAAAFALLFLLPKPTRIISVKHATNQSISISAYKDRTFLYFVLLTALFATCFFQIFVMQPVFFKTEWHFSEKFIGVLMAINGLLIGSIEMVLVYRLEHKGSFKLRYIQTGILLIGIGFAIVNVLPAQKLSALFSICLFTMGEILALPFMNTFWIARASTNNRGQYAGLYSMAWSAAQVLAPTVGSQIITHANYATLWWFILIVCIITTICFNYLGKLKQSFAL